MDVITFGETMVLFTSESVGPLRYAGKFDKTIGGAESNVAISLSRLGHQVGWFGRLGQDEFGIYIHNFIRGEGVDTSRVIFDSSYPTAVFFKERHAMQEPKIYYYRKNSAASFLSPKDIDESYIAQAKYLHITGITPALSKSCNDAVYRVIEVAKKNRLKIIFDPNIRLKLWGEDEARERLMDIARQCDIILPGLEEGQMLTYESNPKNIAACLLKTGVDVVVLKLGEKGAYYATNNKQEFVPSFPVKQVVDPTGAGDGFAAGFISGLIRGWSYQKAVELGNRVGSFAVSVPGDIEGYPFWSEVSPKHKVIHR